MLLAQHNITSRKDWKKWMLQNHPDKNPSADVTLVARVNKAVDLAYPA
jgi:hypothetical protein